MRTVVHASVHKRAHTCTPRSTPSAHATVCKARALVAKPQHRPDSLNTHKLSTTTTPFFGGVLVLRVLVLKRTWFAKRRSFLAANLNVWRIQHARLDLYHFRFDLKPSPPGEIKGGGNTSLVQFVSRRGRIELELGMHSSAVPDMA
eukprot:2873488-Rhodomonas_salina.2